MNNHNNKTKKELLAEIARLEARLMVSHTQSASLATALPRAVLDNANHGVLIHSKQKPLYANPFLAKIYGYNSPHEITTLKSVGVLTHPDHRHEGHNHHCFQENVQIDRQVIAIRKDKSKFWEERRTFLIKYNGQPAVCSMRVDISEQKNNEKKIQESQNLIEEERSKLRDAINSFKDGFALYDSDDKLVICNQSYISNLNNMADYLKPGVSFEKILRTHITRNKHYDTIMRDEAYIRKRLKRHLNPKGYLTRTFSDGKIFQIHEFKTNSGGIVVVLINVTNQKKSEQELNESKERLTNAIESLNEAFAYFDSKDQLVAYNQKFLETRPGSEEKIKPGITYEEFLRIPFKEGPPYDNEIRDEAWFQIRLEQHKNPTGPLYRTLKDGRAIQINEIKNSDGSTVAIRTDISELKNIENQVRKSEKRYRYFAAYVAHELRTHLSSLLLQLDELSELENIKPLKESVGDMSRLVEQLLALARLDSLIIQNDDTVNLCEISTKVAIQLGPIAIKEGLTLEILGAENPLIVRGNTNALEQALRNLVDNAIRYSYQGSLVTIKLGHPGSIKVIDRGKGIPLDIRETIFNRFERVDRSGSGLGLGLSIVQRTVDAHGGKVEISDTPNSGSTFTICLPEIEQVDRLDDFFF